MALSVALSCRHWFTNNMSLETDVSLAYSLHTRRHVLFVRNRLRLCLFSKCFCTVLCSHIDENGNGMSCSGGGNVKVSRSGTEDSALMRLPPTQRQLFLRIQQQQLHEHHHQSVSADEDRLNSSLSADECKPTGAKSMSILATCAHCYESFTFFKLESSQCSVTLLVGILRTVWFRITMHRFQVLQAGVILV